MLIKQKFTILFLITLEENAFNKIRLTGEEHLKAHELLVEVYNLLADKYVINMRYKNNKQCSYLRIKLSHEMSKKNKTGFNNACQQKARGLQKKAVVLNQKQKILHLKTN